MGDLGVVKIDTKQLVKAMTDSTQLRELAKGVSIPSDAGSKYSIENANVDAGANGLRVFGLLSKPISGYHNNHSFTLYGYLEDNTPKIEVMLLVGQGGIGNGELYNCSFRVSGRGKADGHLEIGVPHDLPQYNNSGLVALHPESAQMTLFDIGTALDLLGGTKAVWYKLAREVLSQISGN